MSFRPSRISDADYGAVDPALVSQLISAGVDVADTAITKKRPKSRAAHHDKMEEIAAETPDHSPFLIPAAVLGVAILGGLALYASKG